MSQIDNAQEFVAAEIVPLEWQGKHVVFSPETFRLFRVNDVSASVVRQIRTGASIGETARTHGLAESDVDRLLSTILSSVESFARKKPVQKRSAQPLKTGKLWKLVLMINNFCNLACTYCYEHENVFTQKARHMSPELIRKTLAEFYESFEVIEGIMFIGGEPTLSEDAVELACACALEEAAAHGAPRPEFSMITNGARISDRMFDLSSRYSIQLTFSVDGPPPVQDLIRIHHDKSGSYSLVKQNFERYRKMDGAVPQVETTITRVHQNSRISIIDLVDFLAKEFGVTTAHVVPAGLRKGDPLNPYVEGETTITDQVQTAAAITVDRMMASRAHPGEAPAGLFDLAADMVTSLLEREASVAMCPAGTAQLVVDAQGDILPCWMFAGMPEMTMGNILRDSRKSPARYPAEQDRAQQQAGEYRMRHLLRASRVPRVYRQPSEYQRIDRRCRS